MFIMIEIAPIVIIVVVLLLLMHVSISAGLILALAAIMGGAVVVTAGIVGYVAIRLHASRAQLPRYEATQEPLRMVGRQAVRPGIEQPREVHNHIHLDGTNPEHLAAYLRYTGGGGEHDR